MPLSFLIVLGLLNFSRHRQLIHVTEITSPGFAAWLNALLLLLFLYGGWQDALLPLGEVKEPHRTVPFSLGAGLLVASIVALPTESGSWGFAFRDQFENAILPQQQVQKFGNFHRKRMDFRFCVFHGISLYPESLNCVLISYQLTADPEV